MVLDRDAADRGRSAADWLASRQARLGRQVARRPAYHSVDLQLEPGAHQSGRLVRLGTACEQLGDLDQLKAAYQEWPFFRTFIDNIEMSIAKTDQRIAKMYLHLGDRQDLSEKVFTEMQLTRKWVLAIVGDEWPLQRRRVLGCAVRVRNPYVDALSIAQVRALREVRMNQDEMAEEKKAEYMSLILSTVTGVSAGLQNTG